MLMGIKKRTFSLSQKGRVKFASTLPWREKVHENERFR